MVKSSALSGPGLYQKRGCTSKYFPGRENATASELSGGGIVVCSLMSTLDEYLDRGPGLAGLGYSTVVRSRGARAEALLPPVVDAFQCREAREGRGPL